MSGRTERSMSFGAVASDYDRLRPGPPQAAVDWLLPQRCDVVVDLGAGTGQLARAVAPTSGRAWAAAALADQFPGASEIEVPMRSRCWRADRVPRAQG